MRAGESDVTQCNKHPAVRQTLSSGLLQPFLRAQAVRQIEVGSTTVWYHLAEIQLLNAGPDHCSRIVRRNMWLTFEHIMCNSYMYL